MASRSRTLVLSILISQLPLLCPAFASILSQPAQALGKAKDDGAGKQEASLKGQASKSDKADKKADKEEKPEKAEKKEKKEKEVKLSEEEIEQEKAFAEHQASLQALLKTVKTPFSMAAAAEEEKAKIDAPMTLSPTSLRRTSGRSLSDRLLASRLYLPGRLVIGHPADFTIKGRPGYWAALAMADRNSGAKPIAGHTIRLGPDRKVVALGKIPASGVLALKMYAPVEGDLIGQSLYFEAAIWPENDPTNIEFAQTITSEAQTTTTSTAGSPAGSPSPTSTNAVLMAAEGDHKKGVRIVPDSAMPMYQRANMGGVTLDSGKP